MSQIDHAHDLANIASVIAENAQEYRDGNLCYQSIITAIGFCIAHLRRVRRKVDDERRYLEEVTGNGLDNRQADR